MSPAPKPCKAQWILALLPLLLPLRAPAKDPRPDSSSSSRAGSDTEVRPRNFRTFLPKQGEAIDDPSGQVVQVLLDRQDKGTFESYMVQVLIRGKPPGRSVRVLSDRVEIDFYDTGKPSMRIAKIRGGAIEASSIEELFYKEAAKPGATGPAPIKRLVRLTLFMHEKAELKFRDTLDRVLIHFRLPKDAPSRK
jgi:hypothetical protein